VNVTRDKRWTGVQSYYTEHGDWFVSLCTVLATFAYFIVRVAKVSPKPPEEEEAA
jgi:apolipoprotein N-acyltransferase